MRFQSQNRHSLMDCSSAYFYGPLLLSGHDGSIEGKSKVSLIKNKESELCNFGLYSALCLLSTMSTAMCIFSQVFG